MKKTIRSIFLALVFVSALVNGCTPVPTPAPVLLALTRTSLPPTNTPVPTSTRTPAPPTHTPMPAATHTKLPTSTVTPTVEPPSITAEFLTDVKILSHEPYENGVYVLKGNSSWLMGRPSYGEGFILKYKLQNASNVSGFSFDTGVWRTDSDRGFGILNSTPPQVVVTQGKSELYKRRLAGNLKMQPDTWYNILMAMGKNETFFAVIWDPTDETQRVLHKTKLGEEWADKSWTFDIVMWGDETISIDDFYKISFGEFK